MKIRSHAGGLPARGSKPGLVKSALQVARASLELRSARLEAQASHYRAGRKLLETGEDFGGLKRSEDGHLADDLYEMIDRGMAAWRNNSVFAGFLTRAVDNIVGTGLEVVPTTGDPNLDDALARAWKEEYCDRSWCYGGITGPESQRIVLFDVLRGGNSLAYRNDKNLQLFEPAQLATPLDRPNDLEGIRHGIQISKETGMPERYWVGPWSLLGYIDPAEARGLRAEDCALFGNRDFASGFRCAPPLGSCLERFAHLDGYLEAELYGARASAMLLAEFNSDQKSSSAMKALGLDTTGTGVKSNSKAKGNADPSKRMSWQPGHVVSTYPGESLKIHTSSRPSANLTPYVRTMFRIVGMRIGLPLEISLLDFSESNFSASRMLIAQALKTWSVYQWNVVGALVRWEYERWMDRQLAVLIPKSAPRPRSFTLKMPKTPWADPLKEALGAAVGIEKGFESVTNIARSLNREVDTIFEERAKELMVAREVVQKMMPGVDPESAEFASALRYVLGNLAEITNSMDMGSMTREA